jgi:hypothetical protein
MTRDIGRNVGSIGREVIEAPQTLAGEKDIPYRIPNRLS